MLRPATLALAAGLLGTTLLSGCATASGGSGPAVSMAQGAPPVAAEPVPPPATVSRPPLATTPAGAATLPATRPLLTDFGSCIAGLRERAAAGGVPQPVVQQAFANLRPNPRVIELDRRQPEYVQTFWQYLDARINRARIDRGQAMLAQHRPLLQRIEARWGVPGRYLVALWGLESNFGENMGGFPVVQSLATLACEGRRGEFFAGELMNALHIAAGGDVTLAGMRGSWAGAMGQPQFMPSTFTRHAIDGDGDGRRDIWGSTPDALSSAANFLNAIGWRPGEEWGQEVVLPPGFDYAQSAPSVQRTVGDWRAMGVRSADGRPLAPDDRLAAVVVPGGWRGPAFLTYPNYDAILGWNRSINYAISVGHLADRLAGAGPLAAGRSEDGPPLSRDDVIEIQTRLVAVGEDAGEPDGLVGSRTREAIRGFQSRVGLPADGHPDQALLWELRRVMGT